MLSGSRHGVCSLLKEYIYITIRGEKNIYNYIMLKKSCTNTTSTLYVGFKICVI